MKKLICFLAIYGPLFSVKAEDIPLYSAGGSLKVGEHVTMCFWASRTELDKVPAWQPESGTRAPLARNEAEDFARKAEVRKNCFFRRDVIDPSRSVRFIRIIFDLKK